MNPALQAIVNDVADAIRIDNAKDAQIASLQAQLANPQLTLVALQSSPWELLWGVGRSHPVTNPPIHGTATFTVGEPATIDYHPIVLPADRDNLYCLRRLAPYVNLARLQQATQFSLSWQMSVNDISAPEAIESDFQRQLGNKVWNMGYQFLSQGSSPWLVRAFNYTTKDWKDTGLRLDPSLLAGGRTLTVAATFTLSDATETHNTLSFNGGVPQQVGFSQPVFTSATQSTLFNVAMQLDANGTAKPYQVRLGKVEVTLS